MDFATQVIMLILAITLALFLTLAIVLIVKLIKLSNEAAEVATSIKNTAFSIESAAKSIESVANPQGVLKVLAGLLSKAKK